MTVTKQDITTAVKNLDLFLRVHQLNGARVKINPNGNPYTFVGGFNMVFQLELQNSKWAFRVWHVPIGENKERYQSISNYLSNKKLPYFTNFIYSEKGLLVNGVLLDTVHMEWLEGKLLKEYLEENLHNRTKLIKLAEKFLQMTKELRRNSISHGDLQEGNILIDNSENIRLVDYDSVCIPEIEGHKELVTGLKGYQHPSRFKVGKASLKSDIFSELIIYVSILSLIEKPILWEKYQLSQTQYLLFTENDFGQLIDSNIYNEIKGLSNQIDLLLMILTRFLEEDSYLNIDPFYTYLDLPKINSFLFDKDQIIEGDEVNLSWEIEGYFNSASINNKTIIVDKATSSIKLYPRKSETWTLTVDSELGEVSKQVQITVNPRLEIVNFAPLQIQLLPNSATEIIWKIENAISAKLDTGLEILDVPLVGSKYVSPSKSQTYKIIATALDGVTVFEETTSVTVVKPSIIKEFKPQNKAVFKGEFTRLTWDVENYTALTVLPANLNVTGKTYVMIAPESTTTYILTAKNELHSVSSECTIQVIKKPISWWIPLVADLFVILISITGWYWHKRNSDLEKIKQIETLILQGQEIAPNDFDAAKSIFHKVAELNKSLPKDLKVRSLANLAQELIEEGDKRCNLSLPALQYLAENNYKLAAILTENPNPKTCK